MASAVASNVHAGPAAAGPMSFGWLGPPRLSFGARDAAAVASEVEEPAAPSSKAEPAAICKDFIDFEFSLGGSATMLPADELFADGKLLPLRPQPAAGKIAATTEAERERKKERRDTALVAEVTPSPEPVRAIHPAAAEAVLDPYVFSPKAPTCSSRWRELLRLRKVQTPQKPSLATSASPSASPAATAVTPSRASSSSAARSLKLLLLQRNGGRASGAAASDLSAAPLLRDSSDSETSLSLASSRFSLSSSSSSSGHDHDDFPRHSLDSVDPTPRPRIRLVRSHPHAPPPPPQPQAQPQPHPPVAAPAPARAAHSPARRRASPSPPPPPSVVSVDSPRMNASGKIVFQGLERSSSSPAGSVHSSMRSRSRVMDRSYSAGVRATPVVLNVPVCSRPVFGFFKDKKDAAAKDAASARARSGLGRRTANGSITPAVGAGGVSGRDVGNGN